MFPAVKFTIHNDLDQNPDEVELRFYDENGDSISVRLNGWIRYASERGAPFDETVSLAEDFLAELASRLGYLVTQ